MLRPCYPWTCLEVFHASIGKVESRQMPAKNDPIDVWTNIGRFFNDLDYFDSSDAYILAAVSPNLEIGPIINAGTNPL
jgi:hypothetical protein